MVPLLAVQNVLHDGLHGCMVHICLAGGLCQHLQAGQWHHGQERTVSIIKRLSAHSHDQAVAAMSAVLSTCKPICLGYMPASKKSISAQAGRSNHQC